VRRERSGEIDEVLMSARL